MTVQPPELEQQVPPRAPDAGARPPLVRLPAQLEVETIFAPLALLVMFVALSVSTDQFLSRANLTNVATQMAILAIVSFGVTIVMIAGAFDLSVGSQVAVHGCVAALVMADTGSITLGVLAGLASGLVFGVVNGLLVSGLAINPFIATLGTLVVARGIALAITDARPVTGLPSSIREFGLGTPLGIPWLVWLMLLCFAVAAYILHVTPFGLRLFALGGNREAARLSGIRVDRAIVLAFALSGLFAAIAGIAVTARLRAGLPTSGTFLELFAVAAVVLGGSSLYGGRGAIWRTLVGVILIAMIQNGLNLLNVSAAYQQITIGLVFILAASSELLRLGAQRRSLDSTRRLLARRRRPNRREAA